MEKTIVVSIYFKLINPKKYFIEKPNEKMHIITDEVKGGYMVKNYMHSMTHQYIEKTKNVETSIKWACDKLINVYPHVDIYKTKVVYTKNR